MRARALRADVVGGGVAQVTPDISVAQMNGASRLRRTVVDLTELLAEVGPRAGRPRNLAADGFTDPSLTERTGLPLVEPFGDELLEMRGWAYGSHWIGCGRVITSRRERTVVVVAKREDPAVSVTGKREDPAVTGFPEGASWAEKLRILTDWDPVPQPAVNWPAVEADLATSLPSDYKEIVDLFGPGGFGTADPDDWPVLVGLFGDWERFDCGLGEFLVRMLTDVQYGFPTSRLHVHFFQSHDLRSVEG
ncbi:hypothetical protein ABT030_48605 [Streptomyces mirabilis]|uniref:hypothetical protein n=1 Tax=Streptomyces mirabilis TaxID=68239 RepID=UPI0033318B32